MIFVLNTEIEADSLEQAFERISALPENFTPTNLQPWLREFTLYRDGGQIVSYVNRLYLAPEVSD